MMLVRAPVYHSHKDTACCRAEPPWLALFTLPKPETSQSEGCYLAMQKIRHGMNRALENSLGSYIPFTGGGRM